MNIPELEGGGSVIAAALFIITQRIIQLSVGSIECHRPIA